MSKSSQSYKGVVCLGEDSISVRNKFRRAVTSSEPLEKDFGNAKLNLLRICEGLVPRRLKFLNSMVGKRHLMFKALLGIFVSQELEDLNVEMSKLTSVQVSRELKKGLDFASRISNVK